MGVIQEQLDAAEVRVLLMGTDRLVPGVIIQHPGHCRRLPDRPPRRIPRLEVPVLQELEVGDVIHPVRPPKILLVRCLRLLDIAISRDVDWASMPLAGPTVNTLDHSAILLGRESQEDMADFLRRVVPLSD